MSSMEASGLTWSAFNVTQYITRFHDVKQVGLCLVDSFSDRPWLQSFLNAPLCFTEWDETLVNRAKNTLEGVKDIARITAGFAFMFFLYYMIKPTPTDAHHHINIFSWKDMPTLKEAVKKDSMLPFLLANSRVVQPASDDVLITAEKLGLDVSFESFYVTKEAYNRIAKQHNFQQLK